MSKLRPIVTVTAFVVCLGISLAAAVRVAVYGIPHHRPKPTAKRGPEQVQSPAVGKQELRETLLNQNVSKLPRDEQVQIARGLEELATTEQIGSLLNDDVTEPQRNQLRQNAFTLARVLLLDKAKRYGELPVPQRAEFLNKEIERWRPFVGLFQLALKAGNVAEDERRQLGEFLADLIRRLAET